MNTKRSFCGSTATVKRLTTLIALTIALGADLLFAPRSASATDFSILAGTEFSQFSYTYPSDTLSQSFRPGLAFGVTANYTVMSYLELEGGLVFMLKRTESFDTVTDQSRQLSSMRGFQIPVLARVPVLKYFALGGGVYYTQGFDRLQRRNSAGASATEPGYSDTNTSRADFGVLGSVQARVWLTHELRGLLDVRYLRGLTDVDTTGLNSKYFSDIQVMLGMTIGGYQ